MGKLRICQLWSLAIALAARSASSLVSLPKPPATYACQARTLLPGVLRRRSMVSTEVNALAQYAPEAIKLFNNMKTPASLIAGGLVGLGFGSPIPLKNPDGKKEGRFLKILRHCYMATAALSLASILLAIMWATVAVNQLTETPIKPASSVWALLQRDFSLPWAAVNAHFVAGMLGFLALLGTRAYFMIGGGLLGSGIAGVAFSGVLLMVSVVNRGVAAGSGDGARYGCTVLDLWKTYVVLFLKRATSAGTIGLLELSSAAALVCSLIAIVRAVVQNSAKDE